MGKLSDLFVKLRLDNKQYNSELNESGKKTSSFGKGVAKIGGLIAGAFAVGQIVSFGKELVELGGVAEGVRSAFERIAPAGTMNDLKEATAGTVSELELMKRAVSAKNLGLPVENLASLFEFATKRAQETGESVDFLVNSIVTGIGRKSPLILDNLGISAVDLRKKLKGVGMETASVADIAAAVGEIAADSMAESGDIIDTNAIKVANLGAEWKNLKLAIAETGVVSEVTGGILDAALGVLKISSSEQLTFWQKISGLLGGNLGMHVAIAEALKKQADEVKRQETERSKIDSNETRNQIAAEQDLAYEQANRVKTIGELKEETDALKKSIEGYNVQQVAEIQSTLAQIEANEKLIKSLTTLRTARSEAPTPMETRGDVPQVGMDFVNEKGLANMQSFFDRMDQQLKKFTADYLSEWNNFAMAFDSIMSDGLVSAIDEFAWSLGNLVSGNIDMEGFFNNILNQLGGFFGTLGKLLIAFGVAKLAFAESLKNIFSGFGAVGLIAAGAGLVAIGGAIGGFASKASSGVGGGGGSSVGGQNFNVITTNQQDQRLVAQVTGNQLNFVLDKYNTNQDRI